MQCKCEATSVLSFAISPMTTETAKFLLAFFSDKMDEFSESRRGVPYRYEPLSTPDISSMLRVMDIMKPSKKQLSELALLSERWNFFVGRIGPIREMMKDKDSFGIYNLIDESKELKNFRFEISEQEIENAFVLP